MPVATSVPADDVRNRIVGVDGGESRGRMIRVYVNISYFYGNEGNGFPGPCLLALPLTRLSPQSVLSIAWYVLPSRNTACPTFLVYRGRVQWRRARILFPVLVFLWDSFPLVMLSLCVSEASTTAFRMVRRFPGSTARTEFGAPSSG